jgi:hypothetical protein
MKRKQTVPILILLALLALFFNTAGRSLHKGQMMQTAAPPATATLEPVLNPAQPGYGMAQGGMMMNGSNGMQGGAMSANGQAAAGCPMMGSMNSTGMNSMGGMGTGMAPIANMAGGGVYPTQTTFLQWASNPWWLLGWVLVITMTLVLLGGLVAGVLWIIRQGRPRQPVQPA